jgi:hypothetical protein
MSNQFTAMASAYGTVAAAMYGDTVTFRRPAISKGSAGGNLAGSPTATTPASIPCRYRPASGREIQLAGKPVSGTAYMIFVPAQFSSQLVDVDGECQAVIAARGGDLGEPSRSLQVQWIGRDRGIETHVLASSEE